MSSPQGAPEAELPPRPAQRSKNQWWRLCPSAAAAQSWQTLVGHAIRFEIAIIILCLTSLPFTIIAGLKYASKATLAGDIVCTFFSILSCALTLWGLLKSNSTTMSTLIRNIVLCVAWLCASVGARYSYYSWYDDHKLDDDFNTNTAWSVIARSAFYWAIEVSFFMYFVLAWFANSRERKAKLQQQYGLQGVPHYQPGAHQGAYAGPPQGVYAGPPEGAYAGPPQGYAGPPPSYAPPPGPPPGRFA